MSEVTKEELLEVVKTGKIPEMKYILNTTTFPNGFRQIADHHRQDGQENLAIAFEHIAETIAAARDGRESKPYPLVEDVDEKKILRNLPFNEFFNRLDVLCYISDAFRLTFGNYKE